MHPHHFVLVCLGVVGLPTLLTFFSLLYSHPRGDVATESAPDSPKSGVRALFSFHTPATLFPPSAIISLTDDNSTFFLARPADFGPSLVANGLSGQLWIGSGFGDDGLGRGGAGTGAEGELGCSDVPGWEEGSQLSRIDNTADQSTTGLDASKAETYSGQKPIPIVTASDGQGGPSEGDGTDDHLHHPLASSPVSKPADPGLSAQHPPPENGQPSTHADIQSLQEGAEIAGKVVLLSRGGCGFLEKVKWAQRRGATALIVGDLTRGGPLITMYARGDTSNVSIPSLFTSHTTAHLLSSLIPSESFMDEDDATVGIGQGISGHEGPNMMGNNDGPTFTRESASKSTSAASHPARRRSFKAKGTKQIAMPEKKPSWLRTVFGMGSKSHRSRKAEDTRRPPSSGRHDWFSEKWADEWPKGRIGSSSPKANPDEKGKAKIEPPAEENRKAGSHISSSDDFVIGVQDWRDPDMAAKPSSSTHSIPMTESTARIPLATKALYSKGGESAESKLETALRGGSITPGSGQYQRPGMEGESQDQAPKALESPDQKQSATKSKSAQAAPRPKADLLESELDEDHEGLWVTLTPTTMSTSPFFDTLLVLVVSPLVTLTVVYALLLLRSRIRRRRWRAPKSVVDRLPIRTYHTMSCASTTSSSRIASPQSTSPSSPLLRSSPPSVTARSRPRSVTASGLADAVSASLDRATNASVTQGEKRAAPARTKRKYNGKQVECVVCLEEYVDGESRVMSLPCGHEFHADCM